MTNKPIAHFHLTTPGSYNGNREANAGGTLGAWHDWRANQGLRIRVHSMIPEPEEYALVFALGFVFFHRYFQKKRHRQQATTS